MLNIAFCDDDLIFLHKISYYTQIMSKDLRISTQIYTYSDGNRLISSFSKYQPYFDIVFLDINMQTINGKDIAKKLRTFDKNFRLVFITADESEALDTLQYNISGFILKKHIKKELPSIIYRLVNDINEDNPQIQVFKVDVSEKGKIIIKVPLNDIMFFECINRKVYLYTKRESFALHHYKFSELIRHYIPLGFLDIYRTCIVNARYVLSVDDLEVCLDNGVRLPISRRKKKLILDSLLSMVSRDNRLTFI